MTLPIDNETWVIESGADVIQRMKSDSEGVTTKDKLIYYLWVTDYSMRNAGDLLTAIDMHVDFQTEANRLAEKLSCRFTSETFSLSAPILEQEYFNRFEQMCDEIRRA